MKRVVVSWSGGKDSALTLHRLKSAPDTEVVGLLTVFDGAEDRVVMTMIQRSLVRQQARLAGIPVREVNLPSHCDPGQYARLMWACTKEMVKNGVTHIAFGDVSATEVRSYREMNLKGTGLEPLFPLWGTPPDVLAQEMLELGMKIHVISVDPAKLDPALTGLPYDADFIQRLPEGVNRVGEMGEFHTFVSEGPMFSGRINVMPAQRFESEGYWYSELYPTP